MSNDDEGPSRPLRSASTPGFDPEVDLTPEQVRALPTADQFTYAFLRGMRAERAEDEAWEAAKASGAQPAFDVAKGECLYEVIDADDKHFRVP